VSIENQTLALPPGLGLGWNAAAEQRLAGELARLSLPLCSVGNEVPIPRSLSARWWMELEFQGEVPQCAGAAVTHAAQAHAFHTEGSDTAANAVDLSMTFSWLAGRAKDGTPVSEYNAGATITGVCLAAFETGMILERDFLSIKDQRQWNQRHFGSFAPNMLLAASALRVRGQAPVLSPDHAEMVMGTGQGFIVFGVWWNEGWASIGEQSVEAIPTGRIYGGHAVAVLGYHRTQSGVLYVEIGNSHGRRWGVNGYAMMRADVWWQIVSQSPFGAIVLTTSEQFTVRPFSGWKGVQG